MAERYVCVHGHFYQPPRENPWLEAVEVQDSAYPYHDWNERITTECYAPNGRSRLLDGDGKIRALTSNYAHMSYNFGPTLLSWMKDEASQAYEWIIQADGESRERFGGHGSAVAQAYNHLIMPLANPRDKRTQVLWGLRDFEARFGRKAEGMWLPETAVDLESLDLMAQSGIRFTILSPHQAGRVRPLGGTENDWQDVSGSRIDPTRAYACTLRDGRSIALFFYDGAISQAIAFEQLLASGQDLENRMFQAFVESRDWPQLVHIATDGETYGHHFPAGDMALAFALEDIAAQGKAKLTNYGAYLEGQPPAYEVEIIENTSWSCAHGVERWRSDCGCNTGMHPSWNQAWRAPLRTALDWLRDALAPLYEEAASAFFNDPWAARDQYIDVILDRGPENVDQFLARHSDRKIEGDERIRALDLMELQRHALLMFTSCGWFFDELSGIETVQVIQYAARAMQLAQGLFGKDLEPEFLDRLQEAKSNLPENGDGRTVYERFVRPAEIDLPHVAAHFAISSLYDGAPEHTQIFAFEVDRPQEEQAEVGAYRLKVGQAIVTSLVTRATIDVSYAVLDMGDQNISCKIDGFASEKHVEAVRRLKETFTSADLTDVLRVMDELYGPVSFTLRSAFRDAQRKVIAAITKAALAETEAVNRAVYERHAALLLFLSGLQAPAPKAFRSAAELVLNADLLAALQQEQADPERVASLLDVIGRLGVTVDASALVYACEQKLKNIAERVAGSPEDAALLNSLAAAGALIKNLPFRVNLWAPQNICYEIVQQTLPGMRERAAAGDQEAQAWVAALTALSDSLWMRLPD